MGEGHWMRRDWRGGEREREEAIFSACVVYPINAPPVNNK